MIAIGGGKLAGQTGKSRQSGTSSNATKNQSDILAKATTRSKEAFHRIRLTNEFLEIGQFGKNLPTMGTQLRI
jgi:hypothetical protein